ncbi:MAG: hypothetical protein JO250_04390 [Armatimonadetes bacterium]|nr:hypothetical protein [Armatimonadota bacterium]
MQKVLAHIEARAKNADVASPYAGLMAVPELPLEALAGLGTLHRLDDPANAEALPSLLLGDRHGQAQVEVCPFGPLALITSDGEMDTDPLAQALLDAGIWPLFQNDLDGAGRWHGTPLGKWLFPRRLSDALALFDGLRGA